MKRKTKGIIEKTDTAGFNLVSEKLFGVWDGFKGENSLSSYTGAGYTETRFLWDSFYKTGLKIGDGVGMDGDILWYAKHFDDHITTALRSIWQDYLISKETQRQERLKNPNSVFNEYLEDGSIA